MFTNHCVAAYSVNLLKGHLTSVLEAVVSEPGYVRSASIWLAATTLILHRGYDVASVISSLVAVPNIFNIF